MGSSILRGLMAGAVLLLLAGVTGAIGVFDVSDLAAGGTIVETSPPKLAISLTRLELT